MKTVTIPRDKNEKKSKQTEIDQVFIDSITRSLEDIKHGRVSEWKPKPK